MRAQSHKVNRRQELSQSLRNTSIVCVDTYIGGHGSEGSFFAVRNPSRFSLFIDVPAELKKLEQDFSRCPNHFQLALTQRDTTLSLLEWKYGDLSGVTNHIGNAMASEGMGQRTGIGACAALKLINTRSFSDTVDSLINSIIAQCGGALEEVQITLRGSAAGGTNSYTEIIIAQELASRLEGLGCPIRVLFSLTDSVCFAGLGKSVHANGSCAIDEITKLIISPKTGTANMTVWGLRLLGLPPVGADVKTRRELLLLDRQAWDCSAMLGHRQIIDSNMANSGKYGNIFHTSTDFFRSVASSDIAALNAGEYHSAIVHAIETIRPIPSLITVVDSNHSLEKLFRSSVEGIVDACDSQTTEDMLRATTLSDGIHSYDFAAVNAEGETYDCELIAEHFVEPPKSLDEAIHQLKTVATIRQVLTNEKNQVQNQIARLNAKIRKTTDVTFAAYKRIQTARSFVRSKKVKAIRFGSELRRLSDLRFAYESMNQELAKSISALNQEYDSQLSRLNVLVSTLEQIRQKGRVTERHDLFFFNGVDAAFRDLLTLPFLDHDRKVQVLAAQATMVTTEGIRFIVGAKTNTVEEFARLCIGKAYRPGAWPGAIAQSSAKTIYVLPPTNEDFNKALSDRIESMAPSATVLTADSCEFGINIIRFYVFYPETEADLLPGYLKSELHRVMMSPTKLLHQFPSRNGRASETASH
jgi:hypothetical protein